MLFVLMLALAFGFYMAWSIGANDAANAMGTSVGSKAVSFREAVIIAAVFEFAGAMLAGSDVTDTMRKGIVDPMLFNDPTIIAGGNGVELFVWGMMAALITSAIWIHIAAFLGWPVSTTHSIVGSITGFGVVSLGVENVQWMELLTIVSSWIFSPLMGGVLSFGIFYGIRKLILDARYPVLAVRRWGPVFCLPVFIVLFLVLLFKGLKNVLTYDEATALYRFKDLFELSLMQMSVATLVLSAAASIVVAVVLRARVEVRREESSETKYRRVEGVFRYLQVLTACFVAFAHGSNDVANSIGPLAAIISAVDFEAGTFVATVAAKSPVAWWVLLIGAAGIVVGLATYGYRVIETVGTKITEITPSRGFAAEFGAAATILLGSKLGVPLSTTHTIVGSVIGVGFARGVNALNLNIIWSIIRSWIYTIPFTAILTIVLYYLFTFLFV